MVCWMPWKPIAGLSVSGSRAGTLTGLPEGRYALKATLALRGRTIERSAPFLMGSLEAALAQENQARAIPKGSPG